MKIHEYNEMMRHLTRREPSDKHLASSNPLNIPAHMQHQMEGGQLTPEEFYQNQSIPITERPLTGAEGGRVYDTRKYLQGGRVEPRVGYYEGKLVKIGPHKDEWAVNFSDGTQYFKTESLANKAIADRAANPIKVKSNKAPIFEVTNPKAVLIASGTVLVKKSFIALKPSTKPSFRVVAILVIKSPAVVKKAPILSTMFV